MSFAWTPSSGGPYTLFVQAKDAGGNISAETRYSFSVAPPAPVLAQWLLNDAAGSTTLADSTGNGHTATLASGTLGANSPIVGISALALSSANPDYATAANLVDTTKSYTVSAG